MRVVETEIPGVLVFEPKVFEDARGFFFESFNLRVFREAVPGHGEFVQDNQSGSRQNVVRGMHYQLKQPQGKLVRVAVGRVLDVALDLRRSSATFGKHVAVELSAENRRVLWMPVGVAHGFAALDQWNEVLYKASDYYAPQHERTILWNDADFGIDWGVSQESAIVSEKDRAGVPFASAEVYE